MKGLSMAALLLLMTACGGQDSTPRPAPPPGAVAPGSSLLAAAGEKNPLPDGGWFTWQFAEKPKLGTMIVKVQVFDKTGARIQSAEVVGEYGMPSMRYHDSGPVKFQLSKKGDYLLPVEVVMPGEWELLIRVKQDEQEIYAGKVIFNI